MTVIKLVGPVSKDSHSVRRIRSEQYSIYQEQNVKMTKAMLMETFKPQSCKTVVLMSTFPCTKPIQQCLLGTRKLYANVDWILPLSCNYPIPTRIVQLLCAKSDAPFLGLLPLNPKHPFISNVLVYRGSSERQREIEYGSSLTMQESLLPRKVYVLWCKIWVYHRDENWNSYSARYAAV
jgi:hypothetical protein